MRSAPSSGGYPSRRPPSSAAPPNNAPWEADPRFAAMAEEHERFLLFAQQRQAQHDSLDEATFDEMADWDGAAQPALPASLGHSQHSTASYRSSSRVLLDDDGGDEVSLDVVLAGIAAGRDADLLSRGVPLSELERQQGQLYYQPQYGMDEQLDSSMLDSVLKALEEEEDELEEAHYAQPTKQQQTVRTNHRLKARCH